MQRRNLTGLLMLLVFLFLAAWGGTVLADDLDFYRSNSLQATITRLDANDPDVHFAKKSNFKHMWTTQDPQTREMTSLKWVTRTQFASNPNTIKYKTIAYEFQLANYVAVWNDPLTERGASGEVWYHRVEVSRNNFVQIFARNGKVNEQVIEDALNREDIIHVRAYIQIYHDYNGNGIVDPGEQISMIMGKESEIDTKAHMFPDTAKQDMHSRFQQVLIHPQGKPGPDFFITPEGSTQWQESYKTCAKRYSGKAGTQIKIPIILRNSGAAGITSFGASWWGSGWSNPVIPVQNVFVPEGGSKAFTFTVTVPAQGQEIRLVFCCNIDGNSPANEVNRDNNLTVIEVTSNGLPGTPPGSADDSKVGYIAVVPCTKTIFTGDYYDFKAHYHKPEGSSVEVTEQSTWEVSNSSVAKLETKKGRVKALKPGTLVLSATYKGMTGTADVTVIDEPLPPPPNYSPKADFSISNPSPVEGEKVFFHDESTHEGERYGESIVSWEWTIEGQPGSSSQNTEATWNEVGTYNITLRVEDQDGDSDSCTKSVVVGPALPAAVIQVDPRAVILGRKVNINGDQSTAANGRTIKWDEMQWEFIKPNGTKVTFTGRYPTPDRVTTNSLINQTGIWKVRLKVKDSDNNESEWAEDIFTVYPDNPPQARFWNVNETLRYSYENNEIIIRDLSTSGNPDAALGDEISARDWTLYYDSNNNGVFTDPEDEIILPGQVKSAQIIQQSGNDPNPKIRFYKTGLYKLELSVTESYLDDWDNTLKPGLSANTDSMPEAEKSTMVINIAPTVAFDIVKKTPVDVQFAVDYSVSDEKYTSLLSADAAFKGKLMGAAINPETGMQKVAPGEVGEMWSIVVGNVIYSVGAQILGDWYRITDITSSYMPARKTFALNLSTGKIIDDFTIVASLNDGTYIKGVYTMVFVDWQTSIATLTGGERIDRNLNVITPQSVYDAAIKTAIPESETYVDWSLEGVFTTTFALKDVIFNPDGTLFVWVQGDKSFTKSGQTALHSFDHRLVKLDANLSKVSSTQFATYAYDTNYQIRLTLDHVFNNNNQIIYHKIEPGPNSYCKYTLITVGDQGLMTLGSWAKSGGAYSVSPPMFGATGNGNYYVAAAYGSLCVYSANGQVSHNTVPTGNLSEQGATWLSGRCSGILPWNDQHTAVIYQTIVVDNDKNIDDTYLYLINENTGAIDVDKQYFDILYPPENIGPLGWSGEYNSYIFNVIPVVLNKHNIGLDVYYQTSGKYNDVYFHYYTILKPDLAVGYTSPLVVERSISSESSGTTCKYVWELINDYCFGILEHEHYESYNNAQNKDYYGLRVFDANGSLIINLPKREGLAYTAQGLSNGCFYVTDGTHISMYDGIGQLGWQKAVSELTVASSQLFKGLLVTNPLALANIINGSVVKSVPHNFLFNTNDYLIAYGLSDGVRDGTLKGFGPLQGLQYVNQVVNNYVWDSNKYNFIVSVIDGDSFNDFEKWNNEVVAELKARHLKFVGISPQTGQTKAQIQSITQAAEGGWWININNNMSVPLNELADKIIQAINEERGADNIVLVNQEVELRTDYNDAENDLPGEMQWVFIQDPTTLNGMDISNPQGYSPKHNTTQTVNPSPADGSFASLLTQFDKPGTWKVYCKAKDNPVTTAWYVNHEKAGSKWSNEDANLTVIVHRKPAAYFMVFNSTSNKPGDQLVIQDNSYDPDLQYTDPMNMKGLRVWEWQYRKDGGNWETEYCYDNSGPRGFKSSGNYELRLRVQDNFGAWSDWTDTSPIAIINRPPIADFTVIPNPVAVNHTTMITDCSYDPDGDPIVSYDWTIETPSGNDQFTRTNPASFPYTWSVDGNYLVTLTVTDLEGLSATTTKTVKVSPKQPPVAVIRIPDEVFTDEWFNADGTGSYAFGGNTVVKAYWQYLKPGTADWTSVHEQDIAALRPGETFLKYPIYPSEGEQGLWRIRLLVQDNEGLYSEIAEAEFVVQDGWQITGQIIPEVGERGRYMIVAAYAHRKDKPSERYQIDSMKAELAYLDPACTTSGRAVAEGMETLNMPYDANKADFRVKYLVGQKIYVTDRWPADGTYYIKITGQKGTTRKEIALPFSIKGNIFERFYIQTRSW